MKSTLLLYLLAGLILGAPHLVPLLSPLQIPGLAILIVLAHNSSPVRTILGGICTGLAVSVPLLSTVRLPMVMTLAYLGWFMVLYALLALASRRLPHHRPGLLPLAAASLLCLLEYFNSAALPLFGTAQSLVRPWSSWPHVISFIRFTSSMGIAFMVGLMAGGLVVILRHPRVGAVWTWPLLGVLAIGSSALIAEMNPGRPAQTVAALGFTYEQALADPRPINQYILDEARRAAARGATLFVSPETAMQVEQPTQLARLTQEAQAVAREQKIRLVLGYFNQMTQENQALLIDSTGAVVGTYQKTHLIPFMENYTPGDGSVVVGAGPAGRFSAMICQDDNFMALAGRIGAHSPGVVAVPSQDWHEVKQVHLQNTIHRAIENRYALVRAVSGGISAIIDSQGILRAKKDHALEGPGLILASITPGSSPTLASRFGPYPLLVLSALLWLWTLRVGRGNKLEPSGADAGA